jgi:predicted ester cyclase
MSNHAAIIDRWFEEVWNQGNEATIDEFFSPEGRSYGFPNPDSVIGRDEFKATVSQFRTTFTGIHATVDDSVSEGDKLVLRWTVHMKHTGPGLGFAPTGEPVALTGMALVHTRNGLIVEGWNAFDLTAVVARLSAIAATQS